MALLTRVLITLAASGAETSLTSLHSTLSSNFRCSSWCAGFLCAQTLHMCCRAYVWIFFQKCQVVTSLPSSCRLTKPRLFAQCHARTRSQQCTLILSPLDSVSCSVMSSVWYIDSFRLYFAVSFSYCRLTAVRLRNRAESTPPRVPSSMFRRWVNRSLLHLDRAAFLDLTDFPHLKFHAAEFAL